jgi:hypothetical protein
MGVPVKPKSWALGKNALMALWLSPNCERWHSSKMKTMRLSRSGSSVPCRWAAFFPLLVALAVSSSARPSFWMVVTMTLSA